MHSPSTPYIPPPSSKLGRPSPSAEEPDPPGLVAENAAYASSRASLRSFRTNGDLEARCPVTPADDSAQPGRVSLVLENAGSVARDHLASERTFLAYVRTSLTIASAGVALAQFLTLGEPDKLSVFVPLKKFKVYARPLAVVLILLSLYALFVGTTRYFTVQSALIQGLFPVARLRLGVIAVVLAAIVTVLFGVLLAERPGP